MVELFHVSVVQYQGVRMPGKLRSDDSGVLELTELVVHETQRDVTGWQASRQRQRPVQRRACRTVVTWFRWSMPQVEG